MLEGRLRELVSRLGLTWEVWPSRIVVHLDGNGRQQIVRYGRDEDQVWFESTVVSSAEVARTRRRYRDLARRAWRRNAVQGMVGFAFEARDALVGRVEYPVASLDDEELVEIVREVAIECDRFEMGVLGEDWG